MAGLLQDKKKILFSVLKMLLRNFLLNADIVDMVVSLDISLHLEVNEEGVGDLAEEHAKDLKEKTFKN